MATTPVSTGSGTWNVIGPDFITVTDNGPTAPLSIVVDLTPQNYLSAAPHFPLELFQEPSGNANNFGFRKDVNFTIVNHLGVPMDGFQFILFNEIDFVDDTFPANGHPQNFSHFHGVQPTTFAGLTTTITTPAGGAAAFGPAGPANVPVAGVIHAVGSIADGASVTTTAPIVVHEYEVANRDDNFYLSIGADLSPGNLDKVVEATKPPSPSHVPQNVDAASLLPADLPQAVHFYTGDDYPLSGKPVMIGLATPDQIFGTINDDIIIAKDGADHIRTDVNTLGAPGFAKASADFNPGGTDFIFAGGGDDVIAAKASTGTLRGDFVAGWTGNDTVYGGAVILAGEGDDTIHAYDGVGATKGPFINPGPGNDQVFVHEAVTGVGTVIPNTLLFEFDTTGAANLSGHDRVDNFQRGDILLFRDADQQCDTLDELEQIVTVTGNNEHFKIALDDGTGSVDVFTPYANTPEFTSLVDVVAAGFNIDLWYS
jgi:hypothetical protein